MISRFRIEVLSSDKEEAQTELDESLHVLTAYIRAANPDAVFDCTDERYPATERDGIPYILGRRVFRVHESQDAYLKAYGVQA